MEQIEWLRIEPRRLFRAEFAGQSYDLKFETKGYAAGDTGWYLVTPRGKVFMARKLQDAANEATRYVQDDDED